MVSFQKEEYRTSITRVTCFKCFIKKKPFYASNELYFNGMQKEHSCFRIIFPKLDSKCILKQSVFVWDQWATGEEY